ncbi:reverse transcriptase domain-containing protein [Tanacetum coccineum]|uniref:Reverse transcriptase domain-containing protein n=1 Tax=Tanacetum coccineum TaxID=301880 RepID=A0ABQ4XRW6_9ASTR
MVDDQPMWGNDQVVAPTLDAAIVMIDLGENFTVKDLLRSCHEHGLARETIIQIFYHGPHKLSSTPEEFFSTRPLMRLRQLPTPGKDGSINNEDIFAIQDIKGEMKEMKKKPTMPTEDIEETTMVEIMEIGVIVNQETITKTHNLVKKTLPILQHPKRNSMSLTLKKTCENSWLLKNHLETKFGRLTDQQSKIPTGTLPSNTQTNPKPLPSNDKHYRPPPAQNEHVNALFTWSGKTYDPPVNPNSKTTIIDDDSKDEADEAEKEVESSSSKKNKSDLPPLKVWHAQLREVLKRSHEQQSKMEQISDAFLNEECSAIVQNKLLPKVGNPGSFLIPYTLANSVEYLALADLGASINLMPYLLYVSLSENNLKPTRMSIRLASHTYQYLMGVAENMLVQVGKFVFLVDFVILQMEEDEKVPLILERPFLHSTDAVIRVKNKELNLGVGDDRITFLIDKAMQHSYSNDDTCFRMDVIDEVTEEELVALLNDSEPLLSTSEKINETSLDKEFEESMAVDVEEIYE